jgi:hypothetical protein
MCHPALADEGALQDLSWLTIMDMQRIQRSELRVLNLR